MPRTDGTLSSVSKPSAISVASVVVIVLLITSCERQDVTSAFRAISVEALDAHTGFLASDHLEGRAPGSRGARLAATYIATQFQLAGLEPAVGDSSFFQSVELISTTSRPRLSFRARGGALYEPERGDEFIARSYDPIDSLRLVGSELVFVGYGIAAPEFSWDDYEGTDVRGKVLLMLVNDPGQHDSTLFRGDTLTYYGRWTYKFEEAARRGAVGTLLIHTYESAGYGWNVLQASGMGSYISLPRSPGVETTGLVGWLSHEAAEHILSMAGFELASLVESAQSTKFRPISTGVNVSATVTNQVRTFTDVNVAGVIRGSDPDRAEEWVIFTSHYDHLGFGPVVDSDSIYNGAYDNASGTALLIALADAFSELRERPARSLLFLAVTAEESGLLGSEYYAQNPLFPLEVTAANINLDGANVWGRTEDLVVIGAGHSSLEGIVAAAAGAEGLRLEGDPAPHLGYAYRSDQFSFMKRGVPVAYIEHGLEFIGRMPGWGEEMRENYNRNRYHQPSDEYDPGFDYSGAVQQGRVAFRIGLAVANSSAMPTWKEGAEFKAVRDSMLAARAGPTL